ncbi:MarR family winged helix-turn-helix transcriptional regulator [Gordonia sp. SL306]|uniref:MarR family winged helix-turn-helix transcriptional regulator n=1 Tax=Gordonia sp. SL306 TaxID=2995145 RepID=UPI0022701099|nr:MarR family winged helix-turn-helix transcriptional regulator [Gordonia sp. SL306]WAC57611.1 MarR family winged helix-turn-helix transcriptional regulator [Gordonia sp. SL306]
MSTDGDESGVTLWLLWKRTSEVVRTAVIDDVTAANSVSEPELTVLVHLNNAGGTSRQNALVTSTGWDRSRLSHLLTRMEKRGFLTRERLRNGVEVWLAPAGEDLMVDKQRALHDAVERHLISRLDAEQRRALRDILTTLDS